MKKVLAMVCLMGFVSGVSLEASAITRSAAKMKCTKQLNQNPVTAKIKGKKRQKHISACVKSMVKKPRAHHRV